MTKLTLTYPDGRKINNGDTVCTVPPEIIRYMSLAEFTEETITEYCDWHRDAYIPIPLTVSTDAEYITLEGNGDSRKITAEAGRAEITNLLHGCRYKITAGDSTIGFTTSDQTPRTLSVDSIDNTRDIGGTLTQDGKYRIRQGLVYRGSNLKNISEKGMETLAKELKIKTELDVTGGGETSDLAKKYLASEFHSIKWYNLIFCNPDDLPALKDSLKVFTKPENYPVYVHCSLGRDRTGAIAFILKGLCGCSKEDLYREHCLTFFSLRGDGENAGIPAHLGNINALWDCFMNVKGQEFSIRENIEEFLRGIGMTDDDFDAIRNILTEKI